MCTRGSSCRSRSTSSGWDPGASISIFLSHRPIRGRGAQRRQKGDLHVRAPQRRRPTGADPSRWRGRPPLRRPGRRPWSSQGTTPCTRGGRWPAGGSALAFCWTGRPRRNRRLEASQLLLLPMKRILGKLPTVWGVHGVLWKRLRLASHAGLCIYISLFPARPPGVVTYEVSQRTDA